MLDLVPVDVLLEIAEHISLHDSAQLALTCNHIHAHLPLQIDTVICSDQRQFIGLDNHIFPNSGKSPSDRVSHLHYLTIKCDVFDCFYRPGFGHSHWLAKRVVCIVRAAKNLYHLRIESFLPLTEERALDTASDFEWDVENGDIPDLIHIQLYGFYWYDETTFFSKVFPSSTLRLDITALSPSAWECFETFFPFLSSHLPHLETLVLTNEPTSDVSIRPPDGHTRNEQVPSVRELVLERSLWAELNWIPERFKHTFPNLRSLTVVGSSGVDIAESPYVPEWPVSLHLLVAEDFRNTYFPYPPHRLFALCTELGNYIDGIRCCDTSSLVGLTLRMAQLTPFMWDAVKQELPNLRWLELETPNPMLKTLLRQLTLGAIPVDAEEAARERRAERRRVPRHQRALQEPEPRVRPFHSLVCISVLATRFSGDHADEIKALLHHVSSCLPSLRFIALAEVATISMDREIDYAGRAAPWRWWKVTRAKTRAVELVEIPAARGEKVRGYLRNADLAAMRRFGGIARA